MTRPLRLLGGAFNPPSLFSEPDDESSANMGSDSALILLALFCALVCILGLLVVARCVWLRRLATAATPPPPPPLPTPPSNRGLKKKNLRLLPKLTYTADCTSKFTECAICLTEFAAGDEIRELPQCGHRFHVACIDVWAGGSKMTVGAGICVEDGNLMVFGNKVLSDVHDNVVVTPASGGALTNGAFIGVQSDQIGSRRVFPIGKLDGLHFMCVFRFKLWWMTQRMGTSGQDVPFETQFLIVETKEGSDFGEGSKDGVDQSAVYTVFLPILEGDFRAVLQGNELNEIEICLESGDPAVAGCCGRCLFSDYGVEIRAARLVEGPRKPFNHRNRRLCL